MYNVEWASPTSEENSWYIDVHRYLVRGTVLSHFSMWKNKALWLKALSYRMLHAVIYKKHHIFLKFLEAQDSDKVLRDLHDEPAEGHFMGNTTTHKVVQFGFYYPTLFKDSYSYTPKVSSILKVRR